MKIMKAFDTILVALAVATTSLAVGGAARNAIAQSGDTGLSGCGPGATPSWCQNTGVCPDPSKSTCTNNGQCCTPSD